MARVNLLEMHGLPVYVEPDSGCASSGGFVLPTFVLCLVSCYGAQGALQGIIRWCDLKRRACEEIPCLDEGIALGGEEVAPPRLGSAGGADDCVLGLLDRALNLSVFAHALGRSTAISSSSHSTRRVPSPAATASAVSFHEVSAVAARRGCSVANEARADSTSSSAHATRSVWERASIHGKRSAIRSASDP